MSPAPRVPEAGDVVLGKYQILRLLGRGGVGVVFEAEHLRLRQRVAVKFLAPEMLAHPGMVERFEREARAMALLASPWVTRVSDVDATAEGLPFLVMEFLEGHDLQSELKARGALPVAEAVHWVRQACAGMSVVHAAGIVHRDLKPANLFLVESGGARTLKIMDFGISKIASEDVDVTVTTASLGTPAYMSPEQVRSAKHIDARADVWSLGVILYRALTGRLPFQGSGATGMAVAIVNDEPQPLAALRPDVPQPLVAIVERALSKTPESRFASVAALAEALAPFEMASSPPQAIPASLVDDARADAAPSLVGQSLHATPASVRAGAQPRGRAWIVLGAIGAVALVVGVVAFLARAPSPAPSPAAEPAPRAIESAVATPSASAKPAPVPSEPTSDDLEPELVAEPAKPTAPPPVKPSSAAKPTTGPKPAPAADPPKPAPAPKPAATPEKPPSSSLPVLL